MTTNGSRSDEIHRACELIWLIPASTASIAASNSSSGFSKRIAIVEIRRHFHNVGSQAVFLQVTKKKTAGALQLPHAPAHTQPKLLVTIRYKIGIATWIKPGLIGALLFSGVAERGLPLLSMPSSVQVADHTKHRGMSNGTALGECGPPRTQQFLRR